MTGEKNLAALLQSMQPKLMADVYVFCYVYIARFVTLELTPICQFREVEGMTLIITKQQAEQSTLDYEFVSRMITLSVHSSLEAVGFLATVTNKLAEKDIRVNAIFAYYHDHLFVPVNKVKQAMQILTEMTK